MKARVSAPKAKHNDPEGLEPVIEERRAEPGESRRAEEGSKAVREGPLCYSPNGNRNADQCELGALEDRARQEEEIHVPPIRAWRFSKENDCDRWEHDRETDPENGERDQGSSIIAGEPGGKDCGCRGGEASENHAAPAAKDEYPNDVPTENRAGKPPKNLGEQRGTDPDGDQQRSR